MIKIQNQDGETMFVVKDDATKPERVVEDEEVCPKCKQSGENKYGEYPCPVCGRNLLWDEEEE
jgi:hypothetical protein